MAAVVFAFDLGRNGNDNPAGALDPTASPDPSVTAGPGAAISLASVTDFDPFQDGGKPAEKPDQVPLATDGDPQTAWTTSTYKDGPDLTVYKPGVGLLVDLGQSHQVSQVDLVLQGGPHTLQVLATDSAQPPSDPTQMQVVGRATGAEEKTVIELNEGTRARFVVIWLTGLPPAPGGYRGAIADLQVRG
ncbi:MAG: hypothetical protein HZY75_00310 [Nocardioidaceae bacterium]|nr:MAG: hypothetical protein HZY75_00310 [Nocardioidaceae bacterium]